MNQSLAELQKIHLNVNILQRFPALKFYNVLRYKL